MNRYKVEICTESVLVVEACSENEAEKQALNLAWPRCEGLHSSHVTGTTNLSNPITLVADLAGRLQWYAFNRNDGICRFCGGVPHKHTEDCVLGRAHHFLDAKNRPEPHICPTCGTALGIKEDSVG